MFITLNDGQRVFFDVVGEKLALDGPQMREKPTLIVMHGGPGFDHSGLRPDFDAFADIAQVIYIDHRGNGRSVPSNPSSWTLAQWGDDVRAICNALGIEKPIVFGQSFGGMVAQSYATRYPDHPRAVILSSTAARMDFPAALKLFEAKGGAEARGVAERFWDSGSDEEFDIYMRVVMPLYNTTARAGAEDARSRATMRREVYRHFSLPGCEIHAMDFRAALARISARRWCWRALRIRSHRRIWRARSRVRSTNGLSRSRCSRQRATARFAMRRNRCSVRSAASSLGCSAAIRSRRLGAV